MQSNRRKFQIIMVIEWKYRSEHKSGTNCTTICASHTCVVCATQLSGYWSRRFASVQFNVVEFTVLVSIHLGLGLGSV